MPRERKSSQTTSRNSRPNESTGTAPLPGSKEDRRAKLELYLKDFDLQTENHVKAMNAREKEKLHKLEQEWILYRMKIPPQVMTMKLTEFLGKYKGDISVYQRQFASADDSVDNILLSDTDLNPKSTNGDGEKSSPRKRHSNEENLQSLDTLPPLPKTLASKRTLPTKFETPAAASTAVTASSSAPSLTSSSSSTTKEVGLEAPAGRQPLVACTPSNTRLPRRSEFDNPNLESKLILFKESTSGSPLAQDLSEMGTPELKKIQAQIDKMMKMKK